jgi:hypothetical protein
MVGVSETYSSAGAAAVDGTIVSTDRATLEGAAAEVEGRVGLDVRDVGGGRREILVSHVDGGQALSRGSASKGGHADGGTQGGLDGETHLVARVE